MCKLKHGGRIIVRWSIRCIDGKLGNVMIRRDEIDQIRWMMVAS